MLFKPGKRSFILLFFISGFFLLLGLLYAQMSKTDLYYWYTKWDQYRDNRESKIYPYKIPQVVREYRAQPGDSFWNIAKRFNLNIDTIVSFNEVPKIHVIPARMKVDIPFQDGIMIHRRGDQGLAELESRYGIDSRKILFFNSDFFSNTDVFLPGALYDLEERMGKLGTEFLKPLKKVYITSLFGLRIHPITKKRQFHNGVDIRGIPGETVYSAKGGRVIYSGGASGFGNIVVIVHNKGYISKYAHMSRTLVRAGQQIPAQFPIGAVGKTGVATGYHLHFEIWKNGKVIDPRDVTDLY